MLLHALSAGTSIYIYYHFNLLKTEEYMVFMWPLSRLVRDFDMFFFKEIENEKKLKISVFIRFELIPIKNKKKIIPIRMILNNTTKILQFVLSN